MRRAVPWLVAGLGAALVVAGVLVFAAANRGPVDFGWASYSTLQEPQSAYLSAVTFADGTKLEAAAGETVIFRKRDRRAEMS